MESTDTVARRQHGEPGRPQTADRCEQEAVGASGAALVLAELGPGWIVQSDVASPVPRRRTIDHLVVGPGGVFVIDTQSWTGAVRLEDGVLRQNGRARVRALTDVADKAEAVSRLCATTAQPVLCLVRRHVTGRTRTAVLVSSTHSLVPMLVSRPPVLSADDVRRVAAELRLRLAPAPSVTADDAGWSHRVPYRSSSTG